MAPYIDSPPPLTSSTHQRENAAYNSNANLAFSRAVQYRQLVSRAVTQRLHSLSLDDLTTFSGDAWEKTDRVKARERVRRDVQLLGVAWGMYIRGMEKRKDRTVLIENDNADDVMVDTFKRDVERAGEERHVLSPVRYEAVKSVNGSGNGNGDGKAVAQNREAACERREDADRGDVGVRELHVRQQALVGMLMKLGRLRGGV
ncbi:hypothetical protein BU26DRAFT_595370 [Trematosphaeria pertusa]|uniref:Uncharacterized protein n=1 Tax=Trematosphaeria pertusa TaxID=390896 RepID=A0A6A6IIS3_9PLEO|nr:uncharacterized protein BU26DRAFT_595370 [Trematosphaeria pertusa]KAF2249470.1 hypothetical protein BU26DRAFT_595370 [Trematosphaeria pertusa]